MTDMTAATMGDFSKPGMSGTVYQPALLSIDGRLGRVRYVAYSTASGLAFATLAIGLGIVLYQIDPRWVNLIAIVYIPALFAGFVFAKRRLNDLNKSGWLSLLMFVPLVGLGLAGWLTFGRGSESENNYGPPPAPNSTRVVVLCWAVLLSGTAAVIMLMMLMQAIQRY